jgi:hypothetical protein
MSSPVDPSTGYGATTFASEGALHVKVVSGGGGGGGGATGSVTAGGTPGTSAQAVQGIPNGVPQPVSAAELPLPTGASTSGLQTAGNTVLASLDSKTPALSGGRVPTEILPTLGAATRVAAGSASALPSPALPASGLRAVIITAVGTDVRFAVGPSATVTASETSHYLPMGASRTFALPAGQTVAAVSAGPATGALEISEVI